MNEQVEKYTAPVKKFWGKQSKKKKIALISVLAGIVVVSLVIVLILNMKQYTTLFSGLTQEESVEVLTSLQAKAVDLKIQNGGTTILVEKSQEPTIRMQLAVEGHPKTAPGYSLLQDNVDMLTTDAERRTYSNFQTQERMQDTIKVLNGVQNAIVTIVEPKDDGYVWEDNSGEASASVTVDMKPGYQLNPAQVTGIKRVVMTSVRGLTMDSIAVVDADTGEELNASDKMTYVDLATFKRDIEKKFQSDLEKNAERILTPAYGKDNITVVAKTSMNFDEKIKEIITYTPSDENGRGMLENATTDQEKVTGADAEGGVVGTETNAETDLPNYVGLTDDGNSIYFKDGTQYNYLVNKATEQITGKTPVTEDTTISATINRRVVELSAAEIEDLTQSLANATGVLPTKVSVFNTEYINDTIPDIANKPGIFEDRVLVISMSAAAILLIIGLVVVVLISRKMKKKKVAEALAVVNDDLAQLQIIQGENMPNMMEDLKNVPESKEQALKKEIQDFTQKNPEIVAQLLRTWLKGDDADA